jgi:hypothetical protein
MAKLKLGKHKRPPIGSIGRCDGKFVIYAADKRARAVRDLDEALSYFHFVQAFNNSAPVAGQHINAHSNAKRPLIPTDGGQDSN